jgi:hypothetical protein
MQLYVVPTPDTLVGVDTLDSLTYSFRDSAANVTTALSATVAHVETGGTLQAIPAYLVSFVIQHYPAAITTEPGADTLVAQLVDADGSTPARTAVSEVSTGIARARLRIRPGYLATLQDDSVVVIASAKYRGVPINGSGVRLVLRLKQPAAP